MSIFTWKLPACSTFVIFARWHIHCSQHTFWREVCNMDCYWTGPVCGDCLQLVKQPSAVSPSHAWTPHLSLQLLRLTQHCLLFVQRPNLPSHHPIACIRHHQRPVQTHQLRLMSWSSVLVVLTGSGNLMLQVMVVVRTAQQMLINPASWGLL